MPERVGLKRKTSAVDKRFGRDSRRQALQNPGQHAFFASAQYFDHSVILYELLTGTTPLERKRLKEAAWQESTSADRSSQVLDHARHARLVIFRFLE
jgi:hypothetical protein